MTPSNVDVARVALLANEWMAECWYWLAWCWYVDVALTKALAAPQRGTQTTHQPWLLLEVEMSRKSHVNWSPAGAHWQCVLLDKYWFDALDLTNLAFHKMFRTIPFRLEILGFRFSDPINLSSCSGAIKMAQWMPRNNFLTINYTVTLHHHQYCWSANADIYM